MKRRPRRCQRRRRTLQQQPCARHCTRSVRPVVGAFLLLFVLLPLRASGVCRPFPFQSENYFTRVKALPLAGLCTIYRSPLVVAQWCNDSNSPSASVASAATFCTTRSFIARGRETAARGKRSRHPAGYGRKPYKSLCDLRTKRVRYGLPSSCRSYVTVHASVPVPRRGSRSCWPCSFRSFLHLRTTCTVSWLSTLICYHHISNPSRQYVSSGLVVDQLTFILKHHPHCAASRSLLPQSRLLSSVQHAPGGLSFLHIPTVYCSRFRPAVGWQVQHGTSTHIPDRGGRRPDLGFRSSPLQRPDSSVTLFGKENIAGGSLRKHSTFDRAPLCLNSGRWHRWRNSTVQEVCCSVLRCPRGYRAVATGNPQSNVANDVLGTSTRRSQYPGRETNIKKVAERKHLSAAKSSVRDLHDGWMDVATLRDADQREQEAFERVASQVESQLRIKADTFSTAARDLLRRKSVLQHEFRPRGLQQPDQQGCPTNSCSPTAEIRRVGLEDVKPDNEPLSSKHLVTEATDQHEASHLGASSARKRDVCVDGRWTALQIPASLRSNIVASPQALTIDQTHREKAWTQNSASGPSPALSEFCVHKNEDRRSAMVTNQGHSLSSPSLVVESRDATSERQTPVDGKQVHVHIRGELERYKVGKGLNGNHGHHDPQQERLQNDDRHRQVEVGTSFTKEKGIHTSTGTVQNQLEIRTPVRSTKPVQPGDGKLGDCANAAAGAGDEGKRRDRRLIYLLLQSNSVNDVWGLLLHRNIQFLSGAGLVGVVQRLAFLCASPHCQAEQQVERSNRPLQCARASVNEVDTRSRVSQWNRLSSQSSAQARLCTQLQVRAEVKKHPIFKDIMNALPTKIDSLRATEAAALLHALATLRVRSAPEVLERTGAVIAANGFGADSLEKVSAQQAALAEPLKDVILGRLWTSIEIFPTLQHHPVYEALICHTIKRLKTSPEHRDSRREESTETVGDYDSEMASLQTNGKDSQQRDATKTAEHHRTQSITLTTAAAIAKAAVQMRLGSRNPNFVAALQSYILRLLVGKDSKAAGGPFSRLGMLDSKPARRDVTEGAMVRLILSLANLKKQQEQLDEVRGAGGRLPKISPSMPKAMTQTSDRQVVCPSAEGRRPKKLCIDVSECHRDSQAPFAGTTVCSDVAETTTIEEEEEEEDGVFLQALGAFYSTRIATMDSIREQLPRLLKGLSYFYKSTLSKLQLQLHNRAEQIMRWESLRSSMASLPELVVAAAVITKQNENTFDNLVVLADLLIDLNSLLQTSKTLRKVTTHVRAATSRDKGEDVPFARGGAAADLERKTQENEWRRGEEFVYSVIKSLAGRLHGHLEWLLEKLRKEKMAQNGPPDRRTTSGAADCEEAPLTSKHTMLLGKSQELLGALLEVDCTLTADVLVECVRMLVDLCNVSLAATVSLKDNLVDNEGQEYDGAEKEQAAISAVDNSNNKSNRGPQTTAVDSSENDARCASVNLLSRVKPPDHSAEEERLRWRQQLLDGSLLFRVHAVYANRSVRRAIHAANTADELLSAVTAGAKLRWPSMSRLQAATAAATGSEGGAVASPSGLSRKVVKAPLVHSGVGALAMSLDDLSVTSALHRLAVLQQRHSEDRRHFDTQRNVPLVKAAKGNTKPILYDPRMHLLLDTVATKIPTMGQQVTRVMWALEKLHYFDQRDTADKREQSAHERGKSGEPGAGNNGVQNRSAADQTFFTLRRNITLLLLQRIAALVRSESLSGSELSATLRVLAGIKFSSITSGCGPPECDTASWAQAVDAVLQDIRRSAASSLQRGAQSMSGLDVSIALYSLATLGWTAIMRCESPPLVTRRNENHFTLSRAGIAPESVVLFEPRPWPEQEKLLDISEPLRGAPKNVETSSDKGSRRSPKTSRRTSELSEVEYSAYSTLLQRLTAELENCNVQASVVALWALAVTAVRRQQISERQTGDVDDRKEEEEHDILTAIWKVRGLETRASRACAHDAQDATCDPLKHVVEESLMYEKSLWLLPTEDAFLEAVREKLEKCVDGMGRESLSMLLLAALILRWRQPKLLLSAILRTLDILQMQSRVATAPKSNSGVGGYEGGARSDRTTAFPFRGFRGLEKRGEMHSRVWANLAMLQQQLLFRVTGEIDNSEKKMHFRRTRCNERAPDQVGSYLGEFSRAKRQAAAQLKEDLETILSAGATWTSRPQHEWTIQQLHSLLLSWIIIEEDRAQHQQQLHIHQNFAITADALSSRFPGEEDTRKLMQEVFFLLERFASALLMNTATQIGASITLDSDHERNNFPQERPSEAESEAQTSFATNSPAAPANNTKADANSDALGTELTDRHIRLNEWIKRLNLLLFALRRLRQLFSGSLTQKNRFGESRLLPGLSEQMQPATLVPQNGYGEQHQWNFPLTNAPLLPPNTSIESLPHRRRLLAVAAQVSTALLRTKLLRPCHPQLPSLLLELRELLVECALWNDTKETGQLWDLSSLAHTLGPTVKSDNREKENLRHDDHGPQKAASESAALGDTLKDLGQALADWMCLHLDETDDKMCNVVLPLVQKLGAQAHLLRRLRCIALHPVKENTKTPTPESEMRGSTSKIENSSEIRNMCISDRDRCVIPSNSTRTKLTRMHPQGDALRSQRLLMRRSRAASLALLLHHRYRIAFHPPSILLSLLNSATEHVELLATIPHDAAHALSTLQRWRIAFGRAETADDTEVPIVHLSDTVPVRQQTARPTVQECCSSPFSPSGIAPGFPASALHNVLRTRSELLVSGLSQPVLIKKALQLGGVNVAPAGVFGAHQAIKRASEPPSDKPQSTEKEEVLNREDVRRIESCGKESVANGGFTRWDMLSLPQLVHASTAAAQLLELPSAKPVWGRTCCMSEILRSGISETANSRTRYASAASRGRPVNGGAPSNRDTGVGGSSCNGELVAAAAALTRRLLQPAFRTGELNMFSTLFQKTDMTYSIDSRQAIRKRQNVTTKNSSDLQDETDGCLSAIDTRRCTNMHNFPAETFLAQSECPVISEADRRQNTGDCAGGNALRRSFVLPASPQHWRRFRAFVKARREWIAAAGALRLLGGGRNPRDVAQTLAQIACEVADMLEAYRSRPTERADTARNWEEKDSNYSRTYPDEGNLELVDIEKQLAVDDLIEDEDIVHTAEDHSAAGNNATPTKNWYQRNRATTEEQQQLILLQQLACFSFMEISYQLEALHAKSVFFRRRADSTENAADEKVRQALNITGVRILRALASAPVLPTNAAAFLLQPSFVILGCIAHNQIIGNQRTALSTSVQEQVHAKASSTAEAYMNYLATLLRRLLPLAPQWIPRLNSHRAAALFLGISENVKRTHFGEPRQAAEGGTLPGSGLLSLKRSRADNIRSLLESETLDSIERHQTITTDEGSSYADFNRRFSEKSPTRIRRESRRLQTMLLDLQKAILSHARQSPGRLARFWRALTLQIECIPCKCGKPLFTYSESERDYEQTANGTAPLPPDCWKRNTSLDGIFGTAALVSGEQKLDDRMIHYQTVFTEVVRFLNELAASAVLASDHSLQNSLRGNARAAPDAYGYPPGSRPTVIFRTGKSHQVNSHDQKLALLPSCSAALQRTERVDWIYGAVAAAGSGLLGDSTQQRIANAAAEISSGTAAYYSMLSFLANSRDAPLEAIACLAKLLVRTAQDHLSAIRATDAAPAPSGSSQVKDEARTYKRERHILQECELTADLDCRGEEDGREKVTGEALVDVQSSSTKLVRLAKAAWLVWIGTSLQQPKQAERQSILQRGRISRETTELPESLDEQDNRLMKAAKQELEDTADVVCGLLQEEALRITKRVGKPNYAEDDSTGQSVAPSPEDVYSLLTLSLDTAIKFYVEDGEDGACLRRLPRIEAILNALSVLIDAATHTTLRAALKHSNYGSEISTSLPFPSLPSLAYVLHLARQARVYHGPLLNAVAHSIHWHRHNTPLREVGARAWFESSKSWRIHLKDAARRGAPNVRDEDWPSDPAGGGGKMDLWPALLLLADAAISQPQEALRSLKGEFLLLVEPLVRSAPLNHLVRILRFSMNATPIREIPSLNVHKSGSATGFTKTNETGEWILDAVSSSTRLQAADELNARRVHDNVVQRCVTEGGALLLNLRPNGKNYSLTFEDKLAELEASGYAPVGLIDTLNKVHLLHTLSESRSRSATAAEQGNSAVEYSQLPSHLHSTSFLKPVEPKASNRTTATSGSNPHVFVVPIEDAGWWPRILPLVVKHYVRKPSSNLHKAVSGVLSQTLRLAHQNEVWTPTGLSLDIVLHQRATDGKPIAVEVDGPTHYVTSLASSPAAERENHDNAGNLNVTALSSSRRREVPTALTQFKRQLLEWTGWHVVSVPFFEWTFFSRTNPSTLHSEARKTADGEKQSLKHSEPSTLNWEKGTKRAVPAEQLLPGVLLATKLRSLLMDLPLEIDVSGTPGDR